MYGKEYGIVLKRFIPSNHKYSILSKSRGKIVLVVLKRNFIKTISSGMQLSFIVDDQNSNLHITKHLNIISAPLMKRYRDMLWLHHLLEICYFFIPLHQPCEEFFYLLSNYFSLFELYDHFYNNWECIHKAYLGVLMILMGFFPPKHLQKALIRIKSTLLFNIDFAQALKVKSLIMCLKDFNMLSCNEFDMWIQECIQSHPRRHMFKTLEFFTNDY